MIAGDFGDVEPGAIEGWQVGQLDLLAEAAETSNSTRRARGRPLNSPNRRNADMFDYLEARGFKAPEVALMEIVAADPRELAAKLAGCLPFNVSFDRALEVLKLQVRAASDLMPYKLAKRPASVEITSKKLHLFMAGNLSPEQQAQIEQNQWVSLGDGVRQNDNPSQDRVNDEADQGDSTVQAAVLKSAVPD